LPPLGFRGSLENAIDKFKIACVLNERRLKGLGPIVLSIEAREDTSLGGAPILSVDHVLGQFPSKASDFFNRTLLNLSRLAERPFDRITLDSAKGRFSLFCQDERGRTPFLRELAQQGLIRFNEVPGGLQYDVFFLTTRFWEIVENLQEQQVNNRRAFVAMWFDDSMTSCYSEGIKPAIEEAGYLPVRIDLQDFNEKICDEIIAEIRRCKFVVSDFSGQRGGVYFEAGFAKGLGRPVIFTVRKDDVADLHFDTRQYNHIVYETPEELCKKLYNRICATII